MSEQTDCAMSDVCVPDASGICSGTRAQSTSRPLCVHLIGTKSGRQSQCPQRVQCANCVKCEPHCFCRDPRGYMLDDIGRGAAVPCKLTFHLLADEGTIATRIPNPRAGECAGWRSLLEAPPAPLERYRCTKTWERWVDRYGDRRSALWGTPNDDWLDGGSIGVPPSGGWPQARVVRTHSHLARLLAHIREPCYANNPRLRSRQAHATAPGRRCAGTPVCGSGAWCSDHGDTGCYLNEDSDTDVTGDDSSPGDCGLPWSERSEGESDIYEDWGRVHEMGSYGPEATCFRVALRGLGTSTEYTVESPPGTAITPQIGRDSDTRFFSTTDLAYGSAVVDKRYELGRGAVDLVHGDLFLRDGHCTKAVYAMSDLLVSPWTEFFSGTRLGRSAWGRGIFFRVLEFIDKGDIKYTLGAWTTGNIRWDVPVPYHPGYPVPDGCTVLDLGCTDYWQGKVDAIHEECFNIQATHEVMVPNSWATHGVHWASTEPSALIYAEPWGRVSEPVDPFECVLVRVRGEGLNHCVAVSAKDLSRHAEQALVIDVEGLRSRSNAGRFCTAAGLHGAATLVDLFTHGRHRDTSHLEQIETVRPVKTGWYPSVRLADLTSAVVSAAAVTGPRQVNFMTLAEETRYDVRDLLLGAAVTDWELPVVRGTGCYLGLLGAPLVYPKKDAAYCTPVNLDLLLRYLADVEALGQPSLYTNYVWIMKIGLLITLFGLLESTFQRMPSLSRCREERLAC